MPVGTALAPSEFSDGTRCIKKAKNTASIRSHIIITAKGTAMHSTQVRLVGLNDDWENIASASATSEF